MLLVVAIAFSDLRQAGTEGGQLIVGGNVVVHLAVVELLIGHQVEVAGAGEAEEDGLLLAGFLALEGFVDGRADGVAAFRGGQDAFGAGEGFSRFKHPGLGHGDGAHHLVVIQLGQDGAHAVIPQAAGVVRGGNEVGTQGVHLRQRAHHAGVAEVVGVDAAGEAAVLPEGRIC